MAASPGTTKAPREAQVERLRLVAIACIAVFHAFQTTFATATSVPGDGTWAASTPLLWVLGCVSLLGAYGNHVFFLVSGAFLVPSAIARSDSPGYWRDQARRTARRAAHILASVAFYALVALAVDAWVTPLGRVGLEHVGWLVGGLQFVWVYLALVCAAPIVGWLWRRVRHPEALVWAVAAVVFAASAYIAFFSPGDDSRGLLEWRKLMSAASYLVAFLVGGVLGRHRKRLGSHTPLAGAALACVAAEGVAACTRNAGLLVALSFKSTSLLSFALATASVAAVLGPSGKGRGRLDDLVRWLTPAILGYYISQSVFDELWRPATDALVAAGLAAGNEVAALLAGTTLSLAILAATLLADRLVRVRLLRLIGL